MPDTHAHAEAAPATQEEAEEVATLTALPLEVLAEIASALLPPRLFAAPPAEWRHLMNLVSASHITHFAALEALRERVPVESDLRPAELCALAGSLLSGGGASRWAPVRALRAVRAKTNFTLALQAAPKLSGASLCALAPHRLCLFGGRDSSSGDTLKATWSRCDPGWRSGTSSSAALHPRPAATTPPHSGRRATEEEQLRRW